MAWTLCSKQDVMDLHQIQESDLRDSWSELVEGLIKEYKDAPYLGIPTPIVDEYHNGNNTDTLLVNKPPIVSVQSLSVNGASLTASDYIVKETYIQLINQKFPEGRANVKISYTSGETTQNIDASVKLTAIAMIVAINNYRGRGGADSSIKMSVQTLKEGERTPNINVGLILHLKALMRGLLRRDKVRIR